MFNEKRTDLEQEQLHLTIGLAKINETVSQVEELQATLIVKKKELETKNLEANQKLKQLINDRSVSISIIRSVLFINLVLCYVI